MEIDTASNEWVGFGVTILNRVFAPIVSFDQRNVLSYVCAALFVMAVAVIARRKRRLPEPRAIWRLVRRSTVWNHRSSRLDYKWFAVNLVLVAACLHFFVVDSSTWTQLAGDGLAQLIGPPKTGNGGVLAAVTGTLILFCVFDFSYWLGHFLQHRVSFFWEFHKFHHSAEVMTPATEYRQHPFEIILMATITAFFLGLAVALVIGLFGTIAAASALFGFKVLMVAHLVTFHHIRHSHIAIIFTGWAGHVLHSPAHHHIHHSTDPRHFDRNFGYILSVWDWAAGTLWMPVRGQRLTLGIGPEGLLHDSVVHSFTLPFQRVFGRGPVIGTTPN